MQGVSFIVNLICNAIVECIVATCFNKYNGL